MFVNPQLLSSSFFVVLLYFFMSANSINLDGVVILFVVVAVVSCSFFSLGWL